MIYEPMLPFKTAIYRNEIIRHSEGGKFASKLAKIHRPDGIIARFLNESNSRNGQITFYELQIGELSARTINLRGLFRHPTVILGEPVKITDNFLKFDRS